MSWCSKCRQYIYSGDRHQCPPRWLVWDIGNRETVHDARTVYASDPDEAAETWAEHDDRDSAEYSIAGGAPATVAVLREVRGEERRRVHLLTVSGEAVPSYNAAAATDADDLAPLRRKTR